MKYRAWSVGSPYIHITSEASSRALPLPSYDTSRPLDLKPYFSRARWILGVQGLGHRYQYSPHRRKGTKQGTARLTPSVTPRKLLLTSRVSMPKVWMQGRFVSTTWQAIACLHAVLCNASTGAEEYGNMRMHASKGEESGEIVWLSQCTRNTEAKGYRKHVHASKGGGARRDMYC